MWLTEQWRMFKELYNALPPDGQILLTLVVIAIGGFATWRGLTDNKKKETPDPNTIPMWLMIGPVRDALQEIRNIAEDGRTGNAILRDIDQTLTRLDRGQEYTHQVLEAILRNQELAVPPPSRDPHYRRNQL
jgi:hypothetical protein